MWQRGILGSLLVALWEHVTERPEHHSPRLVSSLAYLKVSANQAPLRNGQSTVGGPKWTSSDISHFMVHFANAQIQFGKRSF